MLSVAVAWDLYLQTRSAMILGNVGLVQVTPFLVFALAAGHVADRYDRRRVMIAAQLLLLAASVLLASAAASVFTIYTCLLFMATARAFQGPARQALLPHVVPIESLGTAITWNSSAQEIATVGGPALAGLLIASTSSRVVYFVQVFCAVVALFLFRSIQFRSQPHDGRSTLTAHSFLDGLRFVRGNKLILSALSLDLFAVLFGGATALLPIYAVDILHAGARGLGWLRAAPSFGAITMALTLAHSVRIRRAGRALLFAVAGFGAAMAIFGLSRSLLLSLVMLFLTGMFDNVSVVLRQSLVQTKTPDHVRGRVLAVNNIFISCSNQFGAVESGWTASWFGAVASVVAGGFATILVVAGFAAGSESLRQWEQ